MSFIRHRRATSPNKFECRNYDSKKNFFDTSAVEAVIKLVIEYNPEAIMVIKNMASKILINLTTTYSKTYDVEKLPEERVIRRYCMGDTLPEIPSGKVIGIFTCEVF